MEEFNPQSEFMEELVEEAVNANWILKRNQQHLHKVQYDLSPDPRKWSDEDHHRIALFARYQTAAERTYNRAFARLQSYQKDRERERQKELQKAERAQTPKATKKPVVKKSIIMEQWIEVRRIDNQVVTEFYPPNDEMEQMIADADPKPTLVYRRFFFPDGIPDAYQWTWPRKDQVMNGGMAIQRMTLETWLGLREKEREFGHAVDTGQLTLPDWRDREPADS